MYYLTAEAAFDSAHFLSEYPGKCSNLHGHRWRIVAKIAGQKLQKTGDQSGMLVDFSDLKQVLRAIADEVDHCLLIEKGSLLLGTMDALEEEGFEVVSFPFRPTAENLAKYFFEKMKAMGFPIFSMAVYETPDNCATYEEA